MFICRSLLLPLCLEVQSAFASLVLNFNSERFRKSFLKSSCKIHLQRVLRVSVILLPTLILFLIVRVHIRTHVCLHGFRRAFATQKLRPYFFHRKKTTFQNIPRRTHLSFHNFWCSLLCRNAGVVKCTSSECRSTSLLIQQLLLQGKTV